MNEQEVESRLYAARDAQLRSVDWPADFREPAGDRLGTVAPRRRRAGMLRPVAVGVAVAAVVTLSVALGLPALRGSATPGVHAGTPQHSAAAAPVKRSAACYDGSLPPGAVTLPGGVTPKDMPAWDYSGPAFYATLAHDPVRLAIQLHGFAAQEVRYRTRPGGEFTPGAGDRSAHNLAFLELNYASGFLVDRSFPVSLETAMHQVFATLARDAGNGIQVVPNVRTNKGCVGTGFTSHYLNGGRLRHVIFDQQGNFLGLEAATAPGVK